MQVNKNAIDLLKDLTAKRNWYGDIMPRKQAAVFKSNLFKGKVSYSKASEILQALRWGKIEEETWQRL